jgi:O-antigen ligase
VAPIVVATAAGLRATRSDRFVFTAVAALIMMTSVVLSGSRSGLISLAAALLVLGWMTARRTESRARRALPAVLVVVLLASAVAWVGVDRTAARFEQASTELGERLTAWRDTTAIIRDFPVVGTGFGGYGLAMLVYQTAERHSIYQQAHNEYLQILAEGGILIAIPATIVLVLLVRNIRHRFEGQDDEPTFWLRAGIVAGLIGIAVQSTLEFSLQMPGNALLCAVLLAMAMHRPSSRSHAYSV